MRLKQYVNKNKVFHVDRSTIQKHAKRSAKEQGIKYISIHNFRATVAYRLFNNLLAEGYSENDAKKAVSKKLYHGRGDITIYYVRSAR